MSAAALPTPPIKPDPPGYISRQPGVLGGKPCVAGARVRVQDIYDMHEREGLSTEELLEVWPQLTHAQVYAALAYAWDHREEILALLRRDEAFAAQLRAQQPSLLDKLLARRHVANP